MSGRILDFCYLHVLPAGLFADFVKHNSQVTSNISLSIKWGDEGPSKKQVSQINSVGRVQCHCTNCSQGASLLLCCLYYLAMQLYKNINNEYSQNRRSVAISHVASFIWLNCRKRAQCGKLTTRSFNISSLLLKEMKSGVTTASYFGIGCVGCAQSEVRFHWNLKKWQSYWELCPWCCKQEADSNLFRLTDVWAQPSCWSCCHPNSGKHWLSTIWHTGCNIEDVMTGSPWILLPATAANYLNPNQGFSISQMKCLLKTSRVAFAGNDF